MPDTTPAHFEPALPLEELDRDGALVEAHARVGGVTRAHFLGAAGAATALAAGELLAPGVASARSAAADRDILNYALSLEFLQAAFYTEAERMRALHGPFAEQARVVGAHERAHVKALQQALGRHAMKRPRFDFRGVTENQPAFRRTAVAFEDLAVAAYKDQLPRIRNREYLASAVALHSVEARHAAWIRRLAGRVPAPSSFDVPLPKDHVMRLVASTRFVVSGARTSGRGAPRFTG